MHFRPLLGPNLPVLLRKPGQSRNPRFVAWPLELGLGTLNLWSADLWNPKYASHVYRVTVAVDMLGNIIWICPLGHQQMF